MRRRLTSGAQGATVVAGSRGRVAAMLGAPRLRGSLRGAALATLLGIWLCASCDQSYVPIGGDCSSSDDCIRGAECDPTEAYCHCPVGKIGCGDRCVNLVNDPDNCGYCGSTCSGACVAGLCTGEPDDDTIAHMTQALTISTVYLVGGSAPVATSNALEEVEAVPSWVPSNPANVQFFSALGPGWNSAAITTWDNWNKDTANNSPYFTADNPGVSGGGDAWATYSQLNNMVYASGVVSSGGAYCLGFAGTLSYYVGANLWTAPYQCAVNTPSDQPAAVFDDGTRTMYAASSESGGLRVNMFKDCYGVPGDPSCTRTSHKTIPYGVLKFAIDVNPCTFHAVVAYATSSTGTFDVNLRFYSRDGVRYPSNGADYPIALNQGWGKNPNCTNGTVRACHQHSQTDCKDSLYQETDRCMRNSGRPSVTVRFNPNDSRCYAAVAWDYMANGYIKSRLRIIDITSETYPSIKKMWASTGESHLWNQYLSYVVTNRYTNNIGWFWLSDNQGACSVGMEGYVNNNLALTNISATGKFGGTFPSVLHNSPGGGMGDYMAGVNGGGAGGYLYAAWPESVQTTSSNGASCDNPIGPPIEKWNLAARFARILP